MCCGVSDPGSVQSQPSMHVQGETSVEADPAISDSSFSALGLIIFLGLNYYFIQNKYLCFCSYVL